MLAFEDFTPGAKAVYGETLVSRDDIVRFAREYDAQPMHIDEEAARHTLLGGLIGSGWHSCALMMRMLADNVLKGSRGMGSPGIEEVRWLRPLLPDSTLSMRHEVLETKESRSRPHLGLVRFRFELLDQTGTVLMQQTNWIIFGKRHRPDDASDTQNDKPARVATASADNTDATKPGHDTSGGYFEDCVPGQVTQLGSYRFDAADIIEFARQFDPQPFHLDEVAARHSLFGGLCASGWHTGCIWMKLMVAQRDRARAAGAQARLGPSPGFKNLSWSRPVYAGDTITYTSTVVDRRASTSRPGWGLVFHRNEGVNQRGEVVFSFDGCVFWERRPQG